ncbi:MAG: cytochrome c [Pyrinomonadaceae bacterium]
MKRIIKTLAFILLPFLVLGSMMIFYRDVTVRNREYPIQMGVSPAYRSQTSNPVLPKGVTAQPPVSGTIPRGFKPFHYGSTPEEAKRAGEELTNPFDATQENLRRGEYIFVNNCTVCHGASGGGDGPVIPKYPNPPSFKTDTSRALRDGELFHVITRGRLNMPPHESQVSADDRWKVILYIRRLQAEEKK